MAIYLSIINIRKTIDFLAYLSEHVWENLLNLVFYLWSFRGHVYGTLSSLKLETLVAIVAFVVRRDMVSVEWTCYLFCAVVVLHFTALWGETGMANDG